MLVSSGRFDDVVHCDGGEEIDEDEVIFEQGSTRKADATSPQHGATPPQTFAILPQNYAIQPHGDVMPPTWSLERSSGHTHVLGHKNEEEEEVEGLMPLQAKMRLNVQFVVVGGGGVVGVVVGVVGGGGGVSLCDITVCGASLCVASLCGASLCVASLCGASLCVASLCLWHHCVWPSFYPHTHTNSNTQVRASCALLRHRSNRCYALRIVHREAIVLHHHGNWFVENMMDRYTFFICFCLCCYLLYDGSIYRSFSFSFSSPAIV